MCILDVFFTCISCDGSAGPILLLTHLVSVKVCVCTTEHDRIFPLHGFTPHSHQGHRTRLGGQPSYEAFLWDARVAAPRSKPNTLMAAMRRGCVTAMLPGRVATAAS